jgi:hypothetical protein
VGIILQAQVSHFLHELRNLLYIAEPLFGILTHIPIAIQEFNEDFTLLVKRDICEPVGRVERKDRIIFLHDFGKALGFLFFGFLEHEIIVWGFDLWWGDSLVGILDRSAVVIAEVPV